MVMRKITLLLIAIVATNFLMAQTLQNSDLPIVIINTNGVGIPSEPKINGTMGIIYNGVGVRNSVTDPYNNYNGKIGIEVRGQSSQGFPMQSYGIELRDNAGNSVDQSILGMSPENDWVLYAPYTDKTLMHNFLAYTLSRSLGQWAPNCRYVEVVINGDYKGIYVLLEKIKRTKGRLDISNLHVNENTGDELTGGYIISIDKGANAWRSPYLTPYSTGGQTIQYSYIFPKIDSITVSQRNYIKNYTDSFENAMAGIDFRDPVKGWRRFADENAFMDYFMVNEISKNVDGYRLSSYLYKDKQSKGQKGKLHVGPTWDYDLAFRNANYCNGSLTSGWAFEFNKVCGWDYWQVPFFWYQLWNDSAYKKQLHCRWVDVRQNVLSDNRIIAIIDSVAQLTAEARTRHFQRWPILGVYVWPNPNPIGATYAEEITYLKDWVRARTAWIQNNLPDYGPCYNYLGNQTISFSALTFPNPVSTQLTLVVKSTKNQLMQISLTDQLGRKLRRSPFQVITAENKLLISMSGYAAGIYYLNCKGEGGDQLSLKVVKQ